MFSRQTIKGKGNNFRRCPVAEFRLYACRLMCSEWPERLWAGLFVARLVQVSSNDWLWTACLLMWMGLLWATPFQLGPMKSPVWWSLSTQGLSSQQKGLLFVRTINWWWIIPNPLYSLGQSNGHGCMQTYNTLSREITAAKDIKYCTSMCIAQNHAALPYWVSVGLGHLNHFTVMLISQTREVKDCPNPSVSIFSQA